MTRQEQQRILDHCRRTGTWILADEVYERLYFDASANGCAPSFLDLAVADDRLVVVHSFSKSFLMTGWRLGWLVMPPSMTAQMGKLIEFNTSCVSVFTQRAGIAALENTDSITPAVVAHLKLCRDTLLPLLQTIPGLEVSAARGGMYAFFKLAGHSGFSANRQTAGGRGRSGPGAGRGLRARGKGLAALVFCLARPTTPGAGG